MPETKIFLFRPVGTKNHYVPSTPMTVQRASGARKGQVGFACLDENVGTVHRPAHTMGSGGKTAYDNGLDAVRQGSMLRVVTSFRGPDAT